MNRRIRFVDFPRQYAEERDMIMACVDEVFSSGQFIGGPKIFELEADLAAYAGSREAVALGSGTDALLLALLGIGIRPGDEVITVPNSFVASVGAIVHVGARPVLVDVDDDLNIDPDAVEAAITPRTRAILPVHLTGRMCRMDVLQDIAHRHGLEIVEDGAQAFGARYQGRMAGTWGRVGAFSAHPLKNLSAAGDAGFLTTDDAELAARVRRLRSHGQVDRDTIMEFGVNARMDVLQAVILIERLKTLDTIHERRRRNAQLYRRMIRAHEVELPACRPQEYNVFHTFIIQTDSRDALRAHLERKGIGTQIHYPTPIHLQPAASGLGYRRGALPKAERQADRILTLPIHQHLSEDDIATVADAIDAFFGA